MANNLPAGAVVSQQPNGAPSQSNPQTPQQTPNQLPQGAMVSQQPYDPNAYDYVKSHTPNPPEDMAQEGPLEPIKGFAEGVGSDISGLGQIAEKVLPKKVTDIMHTGEWTNPEMQKKLTPNTMGEKLGYGGETLLEFVLGDEALAGLKLSDKLAKAVGITKALEGSPKIMSAVKVGANAIRQGATQGAQTLVRTGGDVPEAAKEGATMAGVSGVLGGAGELVKGAAGKAAKGAEAVKTLEGLSSQAPENQDILKHAQDSIKQSREAMHRAFENGVNDFSHKLNGATIEPKGSPMQAGAKSVLQDTEFKEHPLIEDVKEAQREGLTPKVREFIGNIAKGTLPLDDASAEEKENARFARIALDKPAEATSTAKSQPPMTVDELITLRQRVRKLATTFEPDNVNARALYKMLGPIDDTIGKLADNSGHPELKAEYEGLRNDYKGRVQLFDEPVVNKIESGKTDEAARDFVKNISSGKPRFSTDTLRQAIGDKATDKFGESVFNAAIENASNDAGHVNPAKFIDWIKKVPEDTKANLFNIKDPNGAQWTNTKLQQTLNDAHSASNIQHLTRAGLLGGIGAATSASLGHDLWLGTVLGGIVSEYGPGRIQTAKDMLDYIANHPNTWKLFGKVNTVVNTPAANIAGKSLSKAITEAVSRPKEQVRQDNSDAARNVMQGAAGALQ